MDIPNTIRAALARPSPRGSRIAGTNIPANMRAALRASEARAWNHSPMAGALWEYGFRASRAIGFAQKYASGKNNCCADEKQMLLSPRCQTAAPAGRIPEPQNNTKMKTLAESILAALIDYSENGKLTPSNPAIVRDGEGFYYGSALHPHGGMVWDLQAGLGSWTPEPGDDLETIASAAAEMVAAEMDD